MQLPHSTSRITHIYIVLHLKVGNFTVGLHPNDLRNQIVPAALVLDYMDIQECATSDRVTRVESSNYVANRNFRNTKKGFCVAAQGIYSAKRSFRDVT